MGQVWQDDGGDGSAGGQREDTGVSYSDVYADAAERNKLFPGVAACAKVD